MSVRGFEYAVLAGLWGASLWRAPSALRGPKQRALWLAFTALAASMTLQLGDTADGLDLTVDAGGLSALLVHGLGVIAAVAVMEFVAAVDGSGTRRRTRIRRLVAATALAAMGLVHRFGLPPADGVGFFRLAAGDALATGYYLVVLVYLGIALRAAGRLLWSSARVARTRWLRVGARFMALGAAAGVLHTGSRAVYLLGRLPGLLPQAYDAVADAATAPLKHVAVGLILAGSSLPALGVAWRAAHDWRRLRELRPLWEDLTQAVPDVVLHTELLRGPRLRLHRRVIEIQDAALTLAPHTTAEVREAAVRAAQNAGFGPETAQLAAEAFALRAAREARGRCDSPAGAGAAPTGPEEPDFDAEVARLCRLGRAYRSPAADAFLESPGPERSPV
ncbi:MAB_1171c family putative transporter [Streptomyces sp. NPDC004126]|uniref:MAB_1171c family putative transporter n=1 Tax=Streptomyces sp. NPDC004126 TaxID=3390695 RepID=UPI003CFC221E